jgi:D-arginine dehydrogenase
LRTFAPDRLPVFGADPAVPDFFWCVGQGGIGIQTAPAAGALCAALLLGEAPPVDAAPYAPGRFKAG